MVLRNITGIIQEHFGGKIYITNIFVKKGLTDKWDSYICTNEVA